MSFPLRLLVAGLPLLASCGEAAAAGSATPIAEPAGLAELSRALDLELVRTNARFEVDTAHGRIAGEAAEAAALDRYLPIFLQEFSLYPPAVVRNAELERVVFCRGLSFADQLRNAIPDFENDTLYLDVERGAHDPGYLRAVIHHEFFHMIDRLDDGELYGDARWAALNPPGTRYGKGGENAQGRSDTSVPTEAYPGFLTHYATTGVEEDKAETFARMIVDAAYVRSRSESDAVLRSKVERIQELMGGFCPDVRGEFWARAAELDRREE